MLTKELNKSIAKHNSKTIGIVLPYLKARGTEKNALCLAKGFQCKGFRVILFNIQGWGYLYDEFESIGVHTINVGSPLNIGKKRVAKRRVFKLAYLARKHNCDILLSGGSMANQISGYAGLFANIPTIAVFSGRIKYQIPYKGLIQNIRKTLRYANFYLQYGFVKYCIAVSRESGDNFKISFPTLSSKIISIPNGIDIDTIYKQSKAFRAPQLKRNFRICFAGSFEFDRKGLDTLLDAFAIILKEKERTDIELLLVGDGKDREAALQKIHQQQIEDYVLYVGEQNNPFPFIKSSDIFIMPSRREGFGLVLIEAISLGVCSIATEYKTGSKEIIQNNDNGLLVPVDNPNELAKAILKLIDNPKLLNKLSIRGKQSVLNKFTSQKMIDGYIKIINIALNT